MANCGGCNSQSSVCSCVVAPDSGGFTAITGNGSLTAPYAVDPTFIPTPRPLGHISRAEGDSALLLTQNDFTRISFTTNLLIRDGVSVDGGMAGVANRLTATVAGKYLVGGTFEFDGILAAGNNFRACFLTDGDPTSGPNIWAAETQETIFHNPNQPDQILSPISLVELAVGNFIEMWVITDLASEDSTSGPSAQMWAVWMGF